MNDTLREKRWYVADVARLRAYMHVAGIRQPAFWRTRLRSEKAILIRERYDAGQPATANSAKLHTIKAYCPAMFCLLMNDSTVNPIRQVSAFAC